MAGVPAIGELQGALAIDAQALGALRAQAKNAPDAALSKVATQFEALFIQMMLKSMRDTISQDGMFDNEATRTYMGMMDQQLATSLSGKSGFGLSEILVKQLRGTAGAGLPDLTSGAVNAPAAATDANTLRQANPFMSSPFGTAEGYAAPEAVLPQTPSSAPAHVRDFLERIGPHAQAASRETGVPARFIAAQAALESNWGRSEIRSGDGSQSFNLFGVKATRGWSGKSVDALTTEYSGGNAAKSTEKFRAYDSYAEAFSDYARLLKSRYKDAVAAGSDSMQFAQGLQRAGYATDPRYAEKISRVIQSNFRVKA
jgi:flagellar protein FlgJ